MSAIQRLYFSFRSSRLFLFSLCTFCACWVLFNWRTNFDPDFGFYNTILSTEASLNGTVIVMMADKFERYVQKVLDALRTLMESNAAQLAQLCAVTDALCEQVNNINRLAELLHARMVSDGSHSADNEKS